MTDTLHTPPPPAAAAHHQRPFTRDPDRWQRERSRALRTGHVRDDTCSATCQPVLVHERTSWGWLAWTVPGDGTIPKTPHQIGVLTPAATRTQRWALRRLTRRHAQHIAVGAVPRSLRLFPAAVALVGLIAGLLAIRHHIPIDVALPAMLLAPLLAERIPDRLNAWAGAYVRSVEGDGAVRYLQRLVVLHASLVQAAAGSDRYELRRSAEIGHNLLWDTADLLRTQDTRLLSAGLICRERLMLQLATQVGQNIAHSSTEDHVPDADNTREPDSHWTRTHRTSVR